MPKYRIDWKSCSQWQGTEQVESKGEELYETKEQAEAALKDFQEDSGLMQEVHDAAVQGQGVEGWLAVVEAAD